MPNNNPNQAKKVKPDASDNLNDATCLPESFRWEAIMNRVVDAVLSRKLSLSSIHSRTLQSDSLGDCAKSSSKDYFYGTVDGLPIKIANSASSSGFLGMGNGGWSVKLSLGDQSQYISESSTHELKESVKAFFIAYDKRFAAIEHSARGFSNASQEQVIEMKGLLDSSFDFGWTKHEGSASLSVGSGWATLGKNLGQSWVAFEGSCGDSAVWVRKFQEVGINDGKAIDDVEYKIIFESKERRAMTIGPSDFAQAVFERLTQKP